MPKQIRETSVAEIVRFWPELARAVAAKISRFRLRRTIRTIAFLLGALVAGGGIARAQTAAAIAPAPADISVTVTPTLVSQYMFRGLRLGGPSFQPAIEATRGRLVLGVWSNFPLQDKVAGISDPEIDPYGYGTFAVSPALSVMPGFTAYTYPRANLHNGFRRSTFEPNLAVNWTIAGVRLTPKIYYDFSLESTTLELTAAYALPLRTLGTELDFYATGGDYLRKDAMRNSSPATKTWGDYWSMSAALPYQITRSSKLTLGFSYAKGEDAFVKQGGAPKTRNPLAAGRGVVSLAYAWTF